MYFFGFPFVILAIRSLKDHRKAQLMYNVTKFQNGDQFQRQINYYTSLIELRDEDRDASITIKGYVSHHSEFCLLEDCPLRNFKKQMQKNESKIE